LYEIRADLLGDTMENDLMGLLIAEAVNLRVCTQDEETDIIILRLALKFKRITLTEALRRLNKLNLPFEMRSSIESSLVDSRTVSGLPSRSAELPNLDAYDRWSTLNKS
jgi:hypothetical protein